VIEGVIGDEAGNDSTPLERAEDPLGPDGDCGGEAIGWVAEDENNDSVAIVLDGCGKDTMNCPDFDEGGPNDSESTDEGG